MWIYSMIGRQKFFFLISFYKFFFFPSIFIVSRFLFIGFSIYILCFLYSLLFLFSVANCCEEIFTYVSSSFISLRSFAWMSKLFVCWKRLKLIERYLIQQISLIYGTRMTLNWTICRRSLLDYVSSIKPQEFCVAIDLFRNENA